MTHLTSKTEPFFHAGHEFSRFMPDVLLVNRLPLADCVPMRPGDTAEDYVDRLDELLGALSAVDIVVTAKLEKEKVNAKDHLIDGLSSFSEACY